MGHAVTSLMQVRAGWLRAFGPTKALTADICQARPRARALEWRFATARDGPM